MESLQNQHPERPRASQSRAPSRASTSTSSARLVSQTALDVTNMGSSPKHGTPRHHQTACSRASSSPRPSNRSGSRLSRESSGEVARQTAQSSFLQEKLDRERKAESEKVAQAAAQSRLNIDVAAAEGSSRTRPKSPFASIDSEWNRPRSSAGLDGVKTKGPALKEMEQVISNLVKQNFDLKLEIHHRRERQERLESRVDALEADKQQVEDVNDRLLEELEKRDKAVEEAVAMIVMLEAKVDQLVEERTLAQQVKANEALSRDSELALAGSMPRPRHDDNDDMVSKTINRMPSFISEQNENTENLRNVYLNTLGSIMSLSRVPEAQAENDIAPASPTISVLSESSFPSIYGSKAEDETAPTDFGDMASFDGADTASRTSSMKQVEMARNTRSLSRQANRGPSSVTSQLSAPALEQRSPLQQIEMLDKTYSERRENQSYQSPTKAIQGSRAPSGRSPSWARKKEEKRQALRKVVTDAPGGVRLLDYGLPPTPDTMSSSTLHRFKYSDDSLSQRQGSYREINTGASADAVALMQDLRTLPEVAMAASQQANLPAPIRELSQFYDHAAIINSRRDPIQRPHSASETTASHRKGNDWDSDGDETDTRSIASSSDVWLQESAKPNRNGGRDSPDLFGFPASGRTWATKAMHSGNDAREGGARIDLDNDQMQELFSIQNALFASHAPPPPSRRSSLQANTASISGAGHKSGYTHAQLKSHRSPERFTSHVRADSELARLREDASTPTQASFQPPPPLPNSESKRQRYPPMSGQIGARIGLSRIFRRSVSGAPPNLNLESAQKPAPTPATQTPVEDNSKGGASVGVPSRMAWNHVVEDDFASATPPPIMRNPHRSRASSLTQTTAGPIPAHVIEPVRSKTPSLMARSQTPVQVDDAVPPSSATTGGRRKWLHGFGRSSSMRNRTG